MWPTGRCSLCNYKFGVIIVVVVIGIDISISICVVCVQCILVAWLMPIAVMSYINIYAHVSLCMLSNVWHIFVIWWAYLFLAHIWQ